MHTFELSEILIKDLNQKILDIKQMKAEDKKLLQFIVQAQRKKPLWGKITTNGKYKQFASKMINGKRERVYLGNDKNKIADYQRRIDLGRDIDKAFDRKLQIENELNQFYLRLSDHQI